MTTYRFNPFTQKLEFVTPPPAYVATGDPAVAPPQNLGWTAEVVNYATLPTAASGNQGQVYLVSSSSGIWPFTKKAGLYQSSGSSWSYLGANTLSSLADVSVTSPADGQMLTYSAANSGWQTMTPAAGGTGDMTKAVYDPSNTGKAAHAILADGVPWAGITGVPAMAVGDMTKATYDANNDGIVDHAALADAAPWAGISSKPSTFTPAVHSHAESDITGLTTDLAAKVATSTTVNGHALSGNVTVSASDLTTGTLPHAQLPTLLAADIPAPTSQTGTGTKYVMDTSPTLVTPNIGAATGTSIAVTGAYDTGYVSTTANTTTQVINTPPTQTLGVSSLAIITRGAGGVGSSSQATLNCIRTTSGTSASTFTLQTRNGDGSTSEKLRVGEGASGGNLIIGSTTDNAVDKLQVAGTVNCTGIKLAGGTIIQPILKQAAVAFSDHGASGTTAQVLDCSVASHHRVQVTGAFTFSVTNLPASGSLGEILVELAPNGTPYTITWPTINWVTAGTGVITTTFASAGYTLQSTSGAVDFILLWSRDGGTTIYGRVMR